MESDSPELAALLANYFEHPLCGFLILEPNGKIMRANQRMASWMAKTPEELKGMRFSDLLSIGGKIYYETHLWPMLRMQGFFDEVALELNTAGGEKKQVLINAFERRDDLGNPLFVQVTVFNASDRRKFEQNLREQKAKAERNLIDEQIVSGTREQFIAVLGHDLRNPLSSIVTGASMLLEEPDLAHHKPIVEIIQRSGARMAELINNIMDFAQARMGSGIAVNKKLTDLKPIIQHVVDEIAIAWPGRVIETVFSMDQPVHADGSRIAQLCSNLVANALSHGAPNAPVRVRASDSMHVFELSVINQGVPISASAMEKIFQPFTREEHRPSQQGLGLGLFIASEIARAHQGEIVVHSDEQETCFTLRMASRINSEV